MIKMTQWNDWKKRIEIWECNLIRWTEVMNERMNEWIERKASKEWFALDRITWNESDGVVVNERWFEWVN
jgi:hypothetical protein